MGIFIHRRTIITYIFINFILCFFIRFILKYLTHPFCMFFVLQYRASYKKKREKNYNLPFFANFRIVIFIGDTDTLVCMCVL